MVPTTLCCYFDHKQVLFDNFRWTPTCEGLFARVRFRLDLHQGQCQWGLMLHSAALGTWKNNGRRHGKVQCDSYLKKILEA